MKKVRKRAAPKASAENKSPAYLRARKVSRFLFIVLGVFVFIASLYGVREPFAIVIGVLAALPWLALVMVRIFSTLYAIDDFGNNAVRIDLFPLVVVPGVGLIIHAMITVYLVSWSPVFLYAPIGGAVMVGAAALASPGARKSAAFYVAFALFMLPYGGGLAVLGNVLFDNAAPEAIARPILEKRQNSIGKYTAIHYEKVGPWGPFTEPNEVEVSKEFDNARKVGDTVCVFLHPGALGLPWYTAGDCGRAQTR